MGRYLNRRNDLFQRAINSEIYVDKSMLISYTNNHLGTEACYLCVSRPRRFGKSIAANMLDSYYNRGNDSHNQFDGLKIASDPSYEKYINKYNVFHINMTDFSQRGDTMKEKLVIMEKYFVRDLKNAFPEIAFIDETSFIDMLEDAYVQSGVPFIFIIDEWDCIFREYPEKVEEHRVYLDYLRNLMKDKGYIALAYLTGILPVKKYGAHSALNMFTEYSMTNQRELAEFTGFTEDEVRELCHRYDMDYEKTGYWYNGYQVNSISVYNPRSVVLSMTGHDYDNYWTQTETFEALRKYIVLDFDGLRETVTALIAGQKVKINTKSFTNDMSTFEKKDDVLTLLVHLGYLTYDFESRQAWIPNHEVMEEFETSTTVSDWKEIVESLKISDKLLEATLARDEKIVAEYIEVAHQANTSIIQYNDENSLACVLSLAYYSARKSYILQREMPSGKGYADIVFLPRPYNTQPALVIELKWDKTAYSAIEQIKERKYPSALTDYAGEILLVGINYDVKSKEHTCQIECWGA